MKEESKRKPQECRQDGSDMFEKHIMAKKNENCTDEEKPKGMQDKKENAKMKKKLPVFRFERQYMNNTKIGSILASQSISIEEGGSQLKVTTINGKVNVVDLYHDSNVILSPNNITQFDMAVMDAAYTIMCAGYSIITAEWIARALSGNPEKKITQQKSSAIRRSIDKLGSIHIKLDCREEFNARRDTKGKTDQYVYESYFLPIGKEEVYCAANGRETVAYPLVAKSALYEYAEIVRQIIDVPAGLFDTHSKFRESDENILIKHYVIKRVAQILSKNKMNSNKISFLWHDKTNDKDRGLFPELGYVPEDTDAWRDKKRKSTKLSGRCSSP